MNFKEGLRRIGAVLGWGSFLLAGALYLVTEKPSKDSIDWSYKSKLIDSIYSEQTEEYKRSYRAYEMAEAIWPNASNETIISDACSKNITPGRLAICAERKEKVSGLWFDWIKHLFLTLGVAFLCSAVVGLLWWAFSWVLLGFTQPKDPPPKS